jgi:hypothetical protein
MIESRRSGDKEGFQALTCWTARRLSELWDWVDSRDIDKHAVSVAIMLGTYKLTEWAMAYAAAHPEKAGLDLAAVIAAVTGPYMALQAAALAFYFNSRK